MKKKRGLFSAANMLFVLCALCIILALLVAVTRPQPLYLAIAGVVFLLVLLFAIISANRMRRNVRRILGGKKVREAGQESGFDTLGIPAVVLSGERIAWYNDAFRQTFAGGEDVPLEPLARLAKGLDIKREAALHGQNILVEGKLYTVYGSEIESNENAFLAFFIEDTQLKQDAAEYAATRPSVLYFLIDTYDDILKELRESERARIMSEVDLALEKYIGRYNGLLRRVSNARYIAVVEERHMLKLVENRFDILDAARKIGAEAGNVTLSVGVGRLGESFRDCEEKARQALDMALGRGGDQAAVMGPDGYEFYGGLSRSVEKRTKVKSRLVASAIKELMGRYDRVFVMGHKSSDMDSVGSAIGMVAFARICGKQANIVIDEETSLATSLIDRMKQSGWKDVFMDVEDALDLADEGTLLVVVDTHLQYLIESKEVWQACGGTVVIDHHRRAVGHIDDALIFYHEPYASSASELVSELLVYVGDSKDKKPTPLEAEAMLAGIMLDTRTFSLHVGVRTFEASAYLRRMGAETAKVKALFASSMEEYLYRSHLVSEARVHRGCAVVVSDRVPPECEVVSPQAANDLLTIEGVKASFVAIKQGDVVRISARSMGAVNVQLVMEKLKGGGHLTMAGAQLRGVTVAEAEKQLTAAIEQYWEENPAGAANGG